jgi:hypothetical protein
MNNIGAPKGKYKRWHRFRGDATKEIGSFIVGVDPSITPIETGYSTGWIMGSGPHSPEAYANLMVAINERVRNIPKSLVTKQKMRDAKLGVPKSEEHKRNMSISHLARRRLLDEQSK